MASDAQRGGEPGGNDPAKTLGPHQEKMDVQERLKKLEDRMAEFTSALEPLKSEAAALKSLPAEFNALRQEVATPKGGLGQEWLAGYSAEEQESLEKSRLKLECLQEGLRVRRAPA